MQENTRMNSIKKFFLTLRNKHFLKDTRNRRSTLNYSEVKSVGLIFYTQNEQMHLHINTFVNKMRKENKEVEALTFFERNHDNPYNFRYAFFTEKNIGWSGRIKSQEVENFIQKEFDYLYCIAVEEDLRFFEPILARSKAKCRIGNYQVQHESFFELMVSLQSSQDIDILITQMLHYTQAICHN